MNATDIGLTWDGSTTTTPLSCTVNSTFVPPTPSSKTGYSFEGWRVQHIYDEDTCGIQRLNPSTGGSEYGCQCLSGSQTSCSAYGLCNESGSWATKFSYGVVYGTSRCTSNRGTINQTGEPGASSKGGYCWCQITGFIGKRSSYTSGNRCTLSRLPSLWVYVSSGSDSVCRKECARYCGQSGKNGSGFRTALFSTVTQ